MDFKTAAYTYCNYQERCHAEVRNRLYELGANTVEVDNMLCELIEQDVLNEERFAKAYARGKFRIKNWGKQKIVFHLRQKKISPFCIKKGLEEIDDLEYYDTILKLSKKKLEELRSEKNIFIKKAKLFKHLQQKGFETDIIKETFDNLLKNN